MGKSEINFRALVDVSTKTHRKLQKLSLCIDVFIYENYIKSLKLSLNVNVCMFKCSYTQLLRFLRECFYATRADVYISGLNFRAFHHLVTSERPPRSTLSLESNSLYYFEYYEECNSTSLNNLAQWSPSTTLDPPAASVPLAPLSTPQNPSIDLNLIQKNNVFLIGPPPPPPPNLLSTNPSLEAPAVYQSSLLDCQSESVQRSLHWNCRGKIVATPTVSSKFLF